MSHTAPIVQMELAHFPPLPPLPLHTPDPPRPPLVTIEKPHFKLRRAEYKPLVYKATSRSRQCAPANYVNTLTDLLSVQHASDEECQITAIAVASHLQIRLSSSLCTVQLKTQILVHHLLRRSPLPVARYLSQTMHYTFTSRPLQTPTTPNRQFISTYCTYLQHRTALTASFDFPPENADESNPQLSNIFQRASLADLFKILPPAFRVIDALVTIHMHAAIDMSLAVPAFTMLKRDLAILCVTIAPAAFRVAELFDFVDNQDKMTACRLVRVYTALVWKVKRFALDSVDIPTRWPGAWAQLQAVHGDVARKVRLEAGRR